ncbi:hypothetical protein HPB50_022060 [Hyalomma asiaticum]|uniref:Uncharacterized protein n=1 Tax=Hyalomma asiaticum TaxID=266040 RepID=A0ACB7SBM2_HYAAI|nr:hypothetical protein HPB50_022060 [Hyalomma asiaticum]
MGSALFMAQRVVHLFQGEAKSPMLFGETEQSGEWTTAETQKAPPFIIDGEPAAGDASATASHDAPRVVIHTHTWRGGSKSTTS